MKSIFIFSDNQKDNIQYFEREPAILVAMKRSDLAYLKNQEFADFPAIYILIGGNKRYVGQAAGQTITQRLSQHFINPDKSWVDSVIFFSRADGRMSKADTDYLEKKLILDFKEKSDYDLTNSTAGNTSYIDKLQKAKSDQLYETVFEIIDEIANIDLFGITDELEEFAVNPKVSTTNTINYDDKEINASTLRNLYIQFVKELINNDKYKSVLMEMVVNDAASFSNPLGKRFSTYDGRANAVEVGEGVYLFVNLSKKGIEKEIEKISKAIGLKIKLMLAH